MSVPSIEALNAPGTTGAPAPSPTPAPATGAPAPDPQPAPSGTGAAAPATGAPASDDKGKGGKDAVLADLATERDKRQALETTVAEQGKLFEALKTALGLGKSEELKPEQLQEQLTAAQASQAETATELAVYKAALGIADPIKLLDSRSFTNSLKGIDASDTAAIQAKINEAVTKDSTLKSGPGNAGAGDAGAQGPAPVATVDDWIRNAARR